MLETLNFGEALGQLADLINADVAALRLMLSILLSYPLVAFYNVAFTRSEILIKHLYFIITGLGLIYFNYGLEIYHSVIGIVSTYAAMKLLGGTRSMVSLVFIGAVGHLVVGYWVTQRSNTYSFTWTIPQCVLTLRLIAVAFDYYDGTRMRRARGDQPAESARIVNGNKSEQSTSKEATESVRVSPKRAVSSIKNETALFECPTLLEMFSMSYFPASVMVGPQIHMKVLLDYANGQENLLPLTRKPALTRLALSLIYLATFQIGAQFWSIEFLTSRQFLDEPSFFWRATWLAIVVKLHTCKYISTWLMSEGSCILSGVTHDPKTGSFDSMTQARVALYESAATFGGMIRSFNITTNHWAAKYIFKRMRWAGSKFISHLVTLFFLALWHGWHTGYYMTFGMEFLIMKAEWEFIPRFKELRRRNPPLDRLMAAIYWPLEIVGHVYVIYMWGYCLIGFLLFSSDNYLPVYRSMHWVGHVIYVLLILAAQFLPKPKTQD